MKKVAKCPFCRRLYETFSHMVGDQSCCPGCRAEAEAAAVRRDTPDQIRRRRAAFGPETRPDGGTHNPRMTDRPDWNQS